MFRNSVTALVILGSCSFSAMAASKIPESIKQAVVFVFDVSSAGELVPLATAFFVGVPDEQDPNVHHGYLVTAKHVVFKASGAQIRSRIMLRLQKKSGGTETVPIPIVAQGAQQTVYFHSDPTVGLAVISWLPDRHTVDFKCIPDELITDSAQFRNLGISEGTEVFFTGLFAPHPGKDKNYPIARFGRVALISDEKVEFAGAARDLYLVESSSYGGNSGSPVYFFLGPDHDPGRLVLGSPRVFLAGVLIGSYLDRQPLEAIPNVGTPISRSNNGISAVVPAYKLRELLHSDPLVAKRQSSKDKAAEAHQK